MIVAFEIPIAFNVILSFPHFLSPYVPLWVCFNFCALQQWCRRAEKLKGDIIIDLLNTASRTIQSVQFDLLESHRFDAWFPNKPELQTSPSCLVWHQMEKELSEEINRSFALQMLSVVRTSKLRMCPGPLSIQCLEFTANCNMKRCCHPNVDGAARKSWGVEIYL